MEETTTSMLEGMIEEAERYASSLRLLGVLPQIENLLEDMASELRAVTQRKLVERFEDDPWHGIWPMPEELDLMPQTLNVLNRAGIEYIDQLLQLSAVDIINMRGADERTVCDIRAKLSEYGLYLRGDEE